MKIKGLLIGMLACTAMLVGCSDDDVLNNSSENQDAKKIDAYITLSIDASTSSSRAGNDAGGYGDSDGSSEDSGHYNDGTTAESKVNEVLVIITGENDGIVELLDANEFTNGTMTGYTAVYNLTKKYRMNYIGDYKVMTIINPVAALLGYTCNEETKKTIHDHIASKGIENGHAEVYNAVCKYVYSGYVDDFIKDGFMMANREEVPVKLDESHNSPASALVANVEVERAISKITFRPKAGEGLTTNNVYPITIDEKKYAPVTSLGWWLNGNDWEYATFNSANEGTYWVLLQGDAQTNIDYILDSGQLDATKVRGVFTKKTGEDSEHTGIITDVTDNTASTITEVIMEKQTFTDAEIEALILDRDGDGETVTPSRKYYVQLQKYALVNLPSSVYGVRHVAPNDYEANDVKAMGKLDGTNVYLVDPYSIEKNGWNKTDLISSNWFESESTWESVISDAEYLKNTSGTGISVFKELPGTVTASGNLGEGGSDNQTVDTTHDNETVGQLLSYCFENAVKADMQLQGLVTGIVFSGQIFTDAELKNPVAVMYKYKKEYFETLSALLDKYQGVEGHEALADLTMYSDDDAVENTGVVDVYRNGQCFYYSAQIEHYDNDKEGSAPNLGIMEYAIMRNNIYSLSIAGLSNIGSATVSPEPGAAVEDEGAYITMQARILPWIVRFNDIEF